MTGTVALLIVAVIVRIIGALIRQNGRYGIVRAVGWAACMTAVWLAAGAFGAWTPWWPALIAALGGALLEMRWSSHYIRPTADALLTIAVGLLSAPVLALAPLGAATGMVVVTGLAADWLARRINIRLPRRPVIFIGSLVIAALLLFNSRLVADGWRAISDDFLTINAVSSGLGVFPRSRLVYLGVTPAPFAMGERIVLESGAVAWLDRPTGDGPFPGMVFFHGSGSDGSMSPASIAVRRAALDAGYVVLALDHIGFGQSPLPDVNADILAWDPLLSAVEAVETLRAMPEVSTVIVAGYSMGAGDVLRVLPAVSGIDAAILLGASAIPPVDHNQFWYESFHTDRRMTAHLSPERYDELIERFYDNLGMASVLPLTHPPVLFINFEYELDVVLARQDVLYEAVPGCKGVWKFTDTTHYFDLADVAGLALGDTRAVRELSGQFRLLAANLTGPRPQPIC